MNAGWASPRRLVGMALPMAVWALHLVVVYSLAGLACTRGWDRRVAAGLPLVSWWMLVATAIALALIGALGVRALRRWRRAAAGHPAGAGVDANAVGEKVDGPGADAARARRHRFSAGATAVLALLAAVAVLFTAAPLPLLPLCAG